MKSLRFVPLATLVAAATFASPALWAADEPTIVISKELWLNTQTGTSSVAPLNGSDAIYTFGAEVSGFSNAITSATVQANSGTAMGLTGSPGNLELWSDNNTAAQLEALAPHGATYTVRLNDSANVVINSPTTGIFTDYLPAAPVFSFTGVSGTWSTRGDGMGVFTIINPTGDFSLTRSAYSAGTATGNWASNFDVRSTGIGGAFLGGVDSGVQPDAATKSAATITFTTDITAGNASLTDALVAITPGSYEIEGGFTNISNYQSGASVLGETFRSAFLHANYTSFILNIVGTTNVAWSADPGDIAYFGGNGQHTTITLDTDTTAGGIVFGRTDSTPMGYADGGSFALNGSNTLTLTGSTPTITNSWNADSTINVVLAGTDGVTFSGENKVTLTRANTYTGGTTVNSVELALNFAAADAPIENIINSQNALTCNSCDLVITGKTDTENSQTFNGLTIKSAVWLSATAGSGSGTLAVNLGDITRHEGSLLILQTNGAASVTAKGGVAGELVTSNGAAYAIFNDGADWAAWDEAGADVNGNTKIVAASTISNFYTNSTTTTLAGNANVVSDVTLGANTATTSLRFNENQTRTINLGGNTLSTGGILITSAVTDKDLTITGGNLRAANAGGDLMILNGQSGHANALTVSADIVDNTNASSLSIFGGDSAVILSGNNTYTGQTYIDSIARIDSNARLGNESTGATLNLGGTLQTTANMGLSNSVTGLNHRAVVLRDYATFDVAAGTTLTIEGVISGPRGTTGLKKGPTTDENDNPLTAGTGTLVLKGANTYEGDTFINSGTLVTGNASALGTGHVDINSGGTLRVGDGTVATLNLSQFLNVHDGGTLDTSQAGVALTMTGNFNLFSGGIWKIGDTEFQIAFNSGEYFLGPDSIIDLSDFTGKNTSGSYQLFSGTGYNNGVDFINGAEGATYSFDNSGKLIVSAVPEPGAYGLLGAGALAAVALVRRRRKAKVCA